MATVSPLVGDWTASAYLPDGVRIDHTLSLQADGTFVWRTALEGGTEHSSRGAWRHDREERILYLEPSEPGRAYGPGRPELWRELQVAGLEESNVTMLLRRVALASRNLPVLFYRVRPRR